MNTAHTPGPWIVLPAEVERSYIRVRGMHLGKRYKIANVLLPSPGAPDFEASETAANARLIAAAPDMFQLLKDAYALIAAEVADGESTPLACSIRELVAKVIA